MPSESRLSCGDAKPATTTPVITLIAGSAIEQARAQRHRDVAELGVVGQLARGLLEQRRHDQLEREEAQQHAVEQDDRRAATQMIKNAGKNAVSSSSSVMKTEIGTTFASTTTASGGGA